MNVTYQWFKISAMAWLVIGRPIGKFYDISIATTFCM